MMFIFLGTLGVLDYKKTCIESWEIFLGVASEESSWTVQTVSAHTTFYRHNLCNPEQIWSHFLVFFHQCFLQLYCIEHLHHDKSEHTSPPEHEYLIRFNLMMTLSEWVRVTKIPTRTMNICITIYVCYVWMVTVNVQKLTVDKWDRPTWSSLSCCWQGAGCVNTQSQINKKHLRSVIYTIPLKAPLFLSKHPSVTWRSHIYKNDLCFILYFLFHPSFPFYSSVICLCFICLFVCFIEAVNINHC